MDEQKRIPLAVPFREKDAAWKAGAHWDKEKKIWYVEADDLGKTVSPDAIAQWLPNKNIAHAAQQKQAARPEAEFAAEIRAAGLILDGEPIMDGQFQRVPVEGGRRGAKDGAYVGYLDGKPSGHIENFKSGLKKSWTSTGATLTPEEAAHLKAEFEASRLRREQETVERQLAVSEGSATKFGKLSQELRGGTYLERKQVGAHGVRFDGDTVVVPAKDIDGKIWTLQRIPAKVGALKKFEKGGKKAGNMHIIGDISAHDAVLVTEGYATGASIHEATGKPVVVAFDANNLDLVVEKLKERYPDQVLIILGDDDQGKPQNVGRMRAEKAAEKHGVGVLFPQFSIDDKTLTDFNDLHVAEGLDKVRDQVLAAIPTHVVREAESLNTTVDQGRPILDQASEEDDRSGNLNNPGGPDALEPELPRHQVGPDPSSWVNQNAQAERKISDALGITPTLEGLFARGLTAREVQQELLEAGLLDRVPHEQRSTLVIGTRATLGIPSQSAAEGQEEFTAWKHAREQRLLGRGSEEVSTPELSSLREEESLQGDEGKPETAPPPPPATLQGGTQNEPAQPGQDAPAEAAPQTKSPEPAGSKSPWTYAVDPRAMERLTAKRRRESEAARTALGLPEPDTSRPVARKPVEPEVGPAPPPPVGTPAPGAKDEKVAGQQPASVARPADPMANGVSGGSSDNGPMPPKAIAELLESITYEVKSNGSVLYLVKGKAAFVDHGQQILMHDAGNEEDDAIIAAILLGKEKWGKIELTGSQAYKQRALELLVKHNLEVQLKNPEQDVIRRQLVATSTAAASTDNSAPKPLMGTPRSPESAASPPEAGGEEAPVAESAGQPIAVTPTSSSPPPPANTVVGTVTTAPTILASDLSPIRARDWWKSQHSALTHWSKKGWAELQSDLAKLGPEPAPDEVIWFDKGGRRCDPPADAEAFAESLAASDAKKESNMETPNSKTDEPAVLLRGSTKDGDNFRTSVLLFKGEGNFLQGFIEVGGVKRQVIAHICARSPNEDGTLRPNFLRVTERSGSGANAPWKEIGYGNAVNHRKDGKVVHFDEVLFNIGKETVMSRVTSKMDADMHTVVGFREPPLPRRPRSEHTRQSETADPKAMPAAPVSLGAAGANPVATSARRSSRARAAA